MNILGISAFYHDSAACLVADGEIIAAAQEERFTRVKHDSSFPQHAIRYCLTQLADGPAGLDHVVFYDKPFLKFERLLETYLAFAPHGYRSFRTAMPTWLGEKLFQRKGLVKDLETTLGKDVDWHKRLMFSEHHLSHAASAFFPSPFEQAVVLTMDGVGEWATTSLAVGNGSSLEVLREIHFPHSIGLLYSAFTYYTGFKVNSGEYKVMGLAPYGRPIFADLIKDNLIDIKPDGSFRMNMEFFDYCTGLTMTNARFDRLFGGPPRRPEALLTQREMDLAASVQAVTEEVVTKLARSAIQETGIRNLCLAGGVALNCVANGRLVTDGIAGSIWVQPAAGDAGGSVGAALAAHYLALGGQRTVRTPDGMQGAYLGPEYDQNAIESELVSKGARFSVLSDAELVESTAQALAAGKAVGWHQGRMEFGPRALGARSILADPRSAGMQKSLNLRVKFRESFRPFAPSVLREDLEEWFDLDVDSPYMLLVAEVKQEHRLGGPGADDPELFGIDRLNVPRSTIPAVTHVDFSARIQTVHQETNPRYHQLLHAFKRLTGCPVLVNTSFNVRGEPIVMSPSDAYRCFMGTDIEVLVIGNCYLQKIEQDPALVHDYKAEFALD